MPSRLPSCNDFSHCGNYGAVKINVRVALAAVGIASYGTYVRIYACHWCSLHVQQRQHSCRTCRSATVNVCKHWRARVWNTCFAAAAGRLKYQTRASVSEKAGKQRTMDRFPVSCFYRGKLPCTLTFLSPQVLRFNGGRRGQ